MKLQAMDLCKDRVWGDIMQCTAIIFQHMKVVTQNQVMLRVKTVMGQCYITSYSNNCVL